MRRFLVLALSLVGATAWSQKATEPVVGPRIFVEPPSFSFGKSFQNKTLTKEFSLRNYGTEALVVESVSTSCGCTVADLKTKTLKPGESTPLRVSLETRTTTGLLARSVLIKSNDPTRGILEVKVEVTVSPQSRGEGQRP